jgi:hypothetical protein
MEDSAVNPMPASVTVNAKRNQVIRGIVTELTPRFYVMDFQHLCRTAILASPSISFQHFILERLVPFGIQFQSRLFLA